MKMTVSLKYFFIKNFGLTNSSVTILCPYYNEDNPRLCNKDRLFQKDKKMQFSIHPAFRNGYSFVMPSKKEPEISILVFVFTKREYPIKESENIEDMLKCIYTILPRNRCIKKLKFMLIKQSNVQ